MTCIRALNDGLFLIQWRSCVGADTLSRCWCRGKTTRNTVAYIQCFLLFGNVTLTVVPKSVPKMLKDDDNDKKIILEIIFVMTLMDATVTVMFPNHKKHCTVVPL